MRYLNHLWRRIERALIQDAPEPDTVRPELVHDLAQVDRELLAQARRPHYARDVDRIDFLLDMRSALGAEPADGEVLRERPAPRLRHAVPVIPGRT